MVNKLFREAQVRAALLMTEEDGMSTAEYSSVSVYTVRGCHCESTNRDPVVPRHRRYNLP
jgi:hypothetical protein